MRVSVLLYMTSVKTLTPEEKGEKTVKLQRHFLHAWRENLCKLDGGSRDFYEFLNIIENVAIFVNYAWNINVYFYVQL